MLNRHIFFIGMPGSGKSTLGRRVAREVDASFVDLDSWIEQQAGMSVSDIFEKYGEAGFRRMETGALVHLTRMPPALISLGGGTAMDPVNRKILRNHGSVILLDRPLEQILGDLNPADRPLLREDPEGKLRELYDLRMPTYRRLADVTVRNDMDFQTAATQIARMLKDRYHV